MGRGDKEPARILRAAGRRGSHGNLDRMEGAGWVALFRPTGCPHVSTPEIGASFYTLPTERSVTRVTGTCDVPRHLGGMRRENEGIAGWPLPHRGRTAGGCRRVL